MRGTRGLGLALAAALAGSGGAAQETGSVGREQPARASECGPVAVAEFGWEAAQLAAQLLARLIRDGYGCAVGIMEASPERALALAGEGVTPPGAAEPEPAPAGPGGREIEAKAWIVAPGVSERAARAVSGVMVGAALYGGEEQAGWFAPVWLLAANPEIHDLADLARAPELFAAAPGQRPRLHICPELWPCHAENLAVIERLRLADSFEIVTPASGDALSTSLADAHAARAPWVGYYWSPSMTLAEHPMRLLGAGELRLCDFTPAAGPAAADAPPPDCRAPFQEPRVVTAFSRALDQDLPRVTDLLRRFSLPYKLAMDAMDWKLANSATGAQTASHVLLTYPDLWRDWLDDAARERFEAALVAGN